MALELVRAPGGEAATDIRRLLAAASGRALGRRACGAAVRRGAGRADARGRRAGAARAAGGLEEALAAEVIVRDGGRLRFSHPLIAEVVRERTPPAEWHAIHARLAELTDGLEQRARHLAAASDGPDEDVAAALDAAVAQATARGATMAAAELAGRAAELTPGTRRAGSGGCSRRRRRR